MTSKERMSQEELKCDICALPLGDAMIGNGNGSGQRFAHPECYYRARYHESKETIRTLEERVKELEQASAEISGRNVSLHLKKLELERKLKTE